LLDALDGKIRMIGISLVRTRQDKRIFVLGYDCPSLIVYFLHKQEQKYTLPKQNTKHFFSLTWKRIEKNDFYARDA
tara:strand:+ start:487 stop:714 length:228 start_codon:yes stop_codon:yes gene_type:complete